LQKCGEIASTLGGNIVQVIGTKLDDDQWHKIKQFTVYN